MSNNVKISKLTPYLVKYAGAGLVITAEFPHRRRNPPFLSADGRKLGAHPKMHELIRA